MPTVPAIGRLDLTLASLLVVERHRTLRSRRPGTAEILADVLAVADELDVPPDVLLDLDHFEDGVLSSLDRLVESRWLSSRSDAYGSEEMGEVALAWIRTRLARNRDLLHAFEHLDVAVTKRILGSYDVSHARPPGADASNG
jgi:hypothetical protein